MPAASSISRRAHAKLNLALSVGPAQPPRGFHPIASWMVPIDLHDDLTITRLPDGEPSRYSITWAADAPKPSPIDWPIDKDLAVRAHRLLEDRAGQPLPIDMALAKRIPVGGGLGGGSSDAAAMLLALNKLFDLRLPAHLLASLSAPLGSDIAFFIDDPRAIEVGAAPTSMPRAAIVTGLADRVERIDSPRCDLLLLIPPFACPTAPVYAAYDRAGPRPLRENDVRHLARRAADSRSIEPVAADLFNDLADPACTVEPRLRAMLDRLRAIPGAHPHITGSGSTVFMIPQSPDPAALAQLHRSIAQAAPSVVVHPTRIV